MSIILCWAVLFAPLIAAFSFSNGNPTECDSLEISWSGGVAPFFLHLIPVFGVPRNISIPAEAFTDGKGTFSLSQVPLAKDAQVILSMSDATGFATGGTTNVMSVGASKGGKCQTTDPSLPFSFQLNSALTQCRPFPFSGYPTASQPVTIYGIIPSGTSFALHPPTGAQSFSWTANVEHGTSVIFMMTDAQGRQGGSSDIRTVGNSDDRSCLNGRSPSSTSAQPSPTQTQTTKKPTKTPTHTDSDSPSATSSDGASSGGSSAGAIAGIVIGILMAIAMAVTLGLFFLKKRREAKAPQTTTNLSPFFDNNAFGGSNGYSLSSTTNAANGAASDSPYTPQTPQTYNPYGASQPYDQSYGHNYQPSQYAPSTYAPSGQAQTHNHTLSGNTFGAYDGYQGSMLPYDTNPFSDNAPPQHYPPPANYAYQSTYQLPSVSAYSLPHPADPFNPPLTDRSQPLPPLPPPSAAIEDPFAASENASTTDTTTSAQQRKAAMAGTSHYNKPSRILVHTDAEDVLPPPNADGVVELPPQYTERRGGGLAVVNTSPPSPTSSASPAYPQHQPPSSST